MMQLVMLTLAAAMLMSVSSVGEHPRVQSRKAELVKSATMHERDAELPEKQTPLQHAQFYFDRSESVFKFKADDDLLLSIGGTGGVESGDEVLLMPCAVRPHERFKLRGNLIRMIENTQFCLHVEGGVGAGNRLTTWPCAEEGVKRDHEDFVMDGTGRIQLASTPDLCVNVKEGIQLGSELILWPCQDGMPNELFEFKYDRIRTRNNHEYHLSTKDQKIFEPAPVVLWKCEPQKHEMFEMSPLGQIKLKLKPWLCLNVAGGLIPGNKLILWTCSASEPVPDNELFTYDEERNLIYATVEPNLVVHVGDAFGSGSPLNMWPLQFRTRSKEL